MHFRAVRVHFAASVPPARKRLLYCHYVRPRRRGHCANILDAGNYGLAYMGVGFINSSPRYWVQLFTTSQGFTSVTSSSDSISPFTRADSSSRYSVRISCAPADG